LKPSRVDPGRARRLTLLALLLLAASLRFAGLSAGLRHSPHMDERVFVENVERMLAAGDFDHRYYEYPGLFFYILAPVLAPLGVGPDPPARVYWLARAVVASFSLLNVLLTYRLGRALGAPTVGLLAAALMAVSPLAVETGHMLRPDVALATLVLLTCGSLLRLGAEARDDLRSGLGMGAATALKFTGALLAPAYVVARLAAPGPRRRGLVLAGLAALAAFVVLSPYALLHARSFADAAAAQVQYHYQPSARGPARQWVMLRRYAGDWPHALGWPACLCAGLGVVQVLRQDWRRSIGLLVLPLSTLAVFGSVEYHFSRHMLPSLGVVAALAGCGFAALAVSRAAAVGLALLLVAAPLTDSLRYVRAVCLPSTADVIVDWVNAETAEGARVVSTYDGLGFDSRHETVDVEEVAPRNRLQALEADILITSPGLLRLPGILNGVRASFVATPATPFSGPILEVRRLQGLKPAYAAIPLAGLELRSQPEGVSREALFDGSLETAWEASRDEDAVSLELTLPQPVPIARVELVAGDDPTEAAKGLTLLVSEDLVRWARITTHEGRPRPQRQAPPISQVLLLPEVPECRGLRILQAGRSPRPWRLAELRVSMPAGR